MKENVFVIRFLDNGWDWPDMHTEQDIESYCIEEMDVPEEHIYDVEYFDKAFQLTLKRQRSYHNDDWYVNLMRCA